MDKIGSWILCCLLCFGVYSTSDALNCSNDVIPEDQRIPCGLSTTFPQNEAKCQEIGSCCWNESAAKHKCYTRKGGGTCMQYRGEACNDSINNTLSAHRDTPRFFDNKYGLIYTEDFLKRVIALIDSEIPDAECKYILRNLFCHYTLTPCNPEGTSILPFCKEDCLAIFKKCQTSLGYAVGFVKTIIFTEKVNFVHTGLPNCSVYKFEKQYDPAKNETCIRTGFFNYTAAEPIDDPGNEDDNTLVKILVPVIAVLMVVVLVVVIVLIYRRRETRKRQALKNSKLIAFAGSGSMNMRERLKVDSMKSLDSRLLRLFDPDKLKQYPLDEVEYVKDLGEGHFGKVYHGRAIGLVADEPTKVIPIAVKALKEGSNKETKEEFLREVTLMSILDHKNIVRLLAVCTEEEPYGMIFEFMKHGDLNQYIRNAKSAEKSLNDPMQAKVYLTQEDLLSASVQIATGMEYLAKLRFVHRDLASRNCLVDDDLVIKIADFGMSRDLYSSDYYKMTQETLLPIRWLAPEAFLYGKFTIKSDVYAFAVCLWEVYTFGLQPYYGYTNKEVIEFIKKGIHLGKPEDCPPHVFALMKHCWAWDPADRPEFSAIITRLQDPYGNYDVPTPAQKAPSTDNIDAAEPNFGNYDIPKAQDVPKGPNENYDTPKGSSMDVPDNGPKSPLDSYAVPPMTPPDGGFQDEKYDFPRKDSSKQESPGDRSHLIVDSDEHKLNPNEMMV